MSSYFIIPIKETHPYEVYKSVMDGKVDAGSLTGEQKAMALEYLWGDSMPKDEAAGLLKLERKEVSDLIVAIRNEQIVNELDSDTSRRALAMDVMNLRAKIIHMALLLKQPSTALRALTETTKLLQDLSIVAKTPDLIEVRDVTYEVEFHGDGSITTVEAVDAEFEVLPENTLDTSNEIEYIEQGED